MVKWYGVVILIFSAQAHSTAPILQYPLSDKNCTLHLFKTGNKHYFNRIYFFRELRYLVSKLLLLNFFFNLTTAN